MRIRLSYSKARGKHIFRADYEEFFHISLRDDLTEESVKSALEELQVFLIEKHV